MQSCANQHEQMGLVRMPQIRKRRRLALLRLPVAGVRLSADGRVSMARSRPAARAAQLAMVPHPAYTVEPPDFLLVDAIRLVPRPPYKVQPLDTIAIQAFNLPAEEPINQVFPVGPDGTINLGFSYGSVTVAGMTLEEVKQAIEKQLVEARIKNPQAGQFTLGQMGGIQLIRGEHLVRPDGTVGLGIYGSVYVCGMTLDQAHTTIEGEVEPVFCGPAGFH